MPQFKNKKCIDNKLIRHYNVGIDGMTVWKTEYPFSANIKEREVKAMAMLIYRNEKHFDNTILYNFVHEHTSTVYAGF
ncbi:MAG: hypothetical protein K6E85_02920 [Lachnospiraceae bacterium]|nr:hypothetical protein [Lachnospiraceae bacterium]